MKPGKHQTSTQRFQGLRWKVHDLGQSFCCAVSSSVRSKQLLCFAHGQGQKSEQKQRQQRTLSGFITIPSVNYARTS